MSPTTRRGERAVRRRWWIVGTVAALVAVLVALPPTRARLKAGPVVADAVGVTVPRPLAGPVDVATIDLDGVRGDRYGPGWPAPGVVLVPGATRAGRDDGRVQAVARSLAATGRTVFVPELALYDWRLDPDDPGRIGDAAQALAAHTGADVSLVGFSYGGAYSLVAAADPGVGAVVSQVATFGAYFDLVGLIQALTTGVSVVGERAQTWEADPRAAGILVDVLAGFVDDEQREVFELAATGAAAPSEVDDPIGRALARLVVNDDPARTASLAARLPAELRELFLGVSPAAVADDIGVPVVALHSLDDPAVPPAEVMRLQRALPEAQVVTVTIFRHVDLTLARPGQWLAAVPDLARAWRFGGWALGADEPPVPASAQRLRVALRAVPAGR